MTRKRRRLIMIGGGLLVLGAAVALVLTALEENITFFRSPSEVAANDVPAGRAFRLGGVVEDESFKREADGLTVAFTVTDFANSVPVTYKGILPDLFREGQSVVVQGRLQPDGSFAADEGLAKHDESYMPPEVAEALEKAGRWPPKEGRE
jgi:cytochrome c-type biogenesis protein CcmE